MPAYGKRSFGSSVHWHGKYLLWSGATCGLGESATWTLSCGPWSPRTLGRLSYSILPALRPQGDSLVHIGPPSWHQPWDQVAGLSATRVAHPSLSGPIVTMLKRVVAPLCWERARTRIGNMADSATRSSCTTHMLNAWCTTTLGRSRQDHHDWYVELDSRTNPG